MEAKKFFLDKTTKAQAIKVKVIQTRLHQTKILQVLGRKSSTEKRDHGQYGRKHYNLPMQ